MPAKSQTKEVATIDESSKGLMELPADVDWADDGADDVRIQFPMLKLIQGTTRGIDGASKHIGEWYHTDTGEFETDLHVIPLYKQNQRACFEDDAEMPSCSSLDGIAPLPYQPLWQKETAKFRGMAPVKVESITPDGLAPALCAQCPLSQFVDGNAPICGESMLMMVMREDNSFAQMRLGGTALGPVRNRLGKLVKNNKRLPMFTQRWTFSSKETEKGNKKWQQLTVETMPLPPVDALRLNEVAKSLRPQMQAEAQSASFVDESNIIDMDDDDIGYGDD